MKIITTILTFLMPLLAMAETTTDRITVSEDVLQPGQEEIEVYFSIEGSRLYTGYEMDITLPEGLEPTYTDGELDVYMNSDDGFYPSTGKGSYKKYSHTITATYNEVAERTMRIACFSSSNEYFKAQSGAILTLYLKATSFAKPGAVNLQLSNCKLAVWNGETMQVTGYVPEQTVITGLTVGTSATMPLNVSSTAKWGTLMLPFAASLPQGIEAYSCSSNDTEDLILNPVSQLEPFTPYIIYSENGCSQNISGTVTDYPQTDIVTQGYLKASVIQQTLTQGYVLQKLDGEVQFYKVSSERPITIQPGKCWVDIPEQLATKASFGFHITSDSPEPKRGDVNGDGKIDIDDVSAIINIICGENN